MKKKILFSLLTLTSFMPIALVATKCKDNKKENEINLDKKIRLIINVMSFFIIFKKRGI